MTTALPARPDKSSYGATHDMTAPSEVSVSSIYSSNDKFPRMTEYMHINPGNNSVLQAKVKQGIASRAESEKVEERQGFSLNS